MHPGVQAAAEGIVADHRAFGSALDLVDQVAGIVEVDIHAARAALGIQDIGPLPGGGQRSDVQPEGRRVIGIGDTHRRQQDGIVHPVEGDRRVVAPILDGSRAGRLAKASGRAALPGAGLGGAVFKSALLFQRFETQHGIRHADQRVVIARIRREQAIGPLGGVGIGDGGLVGQGSPRRHHQVVEAVKAAGHIRQLVGIQGGGKHRHLVDFTLEIVGHAFVVPNAHTAIAAFCTAHGAVLQLAVQVQAQHTAVLVISHGGMVPFI